MIIREYRSGDADKIVALLAANTTHLRDVEFWLWTNRIWPNENSIVVVAENEGEIVAHYAILPLEIRRQGQALRAGLGIHALVAPSSRGKIPIFQVTKRCYQIAKEKGLVLLFGFPNKNFRLIQEKVEGWQCVSLFRAFEKAPIRHSSCEYTIDTIHLDTLNSSSRVHDLIERFANDSLYSHACSYAYWQRRFILHPQTVYGIHILMDGSRDLGVLVSRVFTTVEGTTEGQVVDMVMEPGIQRIAVISAIENLFYGNTDKVCLWPLEPDFGSALRASGFSQTGFETFFGIKRLDPILASTHPNIGDISKWRLPMAMSDVF
jgi:hypothetical protein